MRVTLPSISVLAVFGVLAASCGGDEPANPSTGGAGSGATGGSGQGGSSGSQGGAKAGGPSTGGAGVTTGGTGAGGTPVGQGGSTAGAGGTAQGGSSGAPTAGTGGGSAGTAGAGAGGQGGSGQGGSAQGGSGPGGAGSGGGGQGGAPSASCPAGPYAASPLPAGATPTKIPGAPPSDAFNNMGNDFSVVEGPVWMGGALYISEIAGNARPPLGRILKITAADVVSVASPDAGTNGLALDLTGNLVGASHKSGSVARLSLTGGAPMDLVSMYMGQRFNSPNDLAFGKDGSLYFSDPDYQAPETKPQAATRVYRVAPGSSTATPIVEGRPQPNGVSVSPDGKTLYVAGSDGVFSHPLMADGTVGMGTRFASGIVNSGDGMGLDCAGNLYVASNAEVIIVSPMGMRVGSIPVAQGVTNVAFGGADAKTLYITSLGNGAARGVFKVTLAIPGLPY